MKDKWQDTLLPSGSEDLVWELFHENSKIGRYDNSLSNEEVRARMKSLYESLPFVGYPVVDLPSPLTLGGTSLDKVITSRISQRPMEAKPIALEHVATLLHYAYGITRNNDGTEFPRPFRTVPSAGALYPLELFFHGGRIEDLKPGLYHYSPVLNCVRLLKKGDEVIKISKSMVQPELVLQSSVIIFLTALFERSAFKYGDRGYRFVMIEAGHVAQNINLVASALNLASVNIGGYFDREIDQILGIDGIAHSTIYMIAIGNESLSQREARVPKGMD